MIIHMLTYYGMSGRMSASSQSNAATRSDTEEKTENHPNISRITAGQLRSKFAAKEIICR